MASDHQDPSRRKHPRSSDHESEKPSKRRHHRHSSQKHEEHKTKAEEETKVEDHAPPPPIGFVLNANCRSEYEMEEGEIVEDEDFGGIDANVDKTKSDSDVECGEIKVVEVGGELVNHITGVHRAPVEVDCSSSLPLVEDSVGRVDRCLIALGEDNGYDGLLINSTVERVEKFSDVTTIHDVVDLQRNLSMEHHTKGDIGGKFCKEDCSQHPGYWFPEGRGKQKSYNEDESELRDRRRSLSSEKAGTMQNSLSCLSSHDRHHEEVHSRNRSGSRDRARGRYQSRSSFQEAYLLQTQLQDTTYYTDRNQKRDSEDERVSRHNRDYQHDGGQDLLKDKEKECSSSYSRHTGRVDRHHGRETKDRDREGSQETWDRDRKWREAERDRRRERERDRDTERERNRDRDRERDRNRDKDIDRVSKHSEYYIVDDGYGDCTRHNDYRHRRLDETDHIDRSRKNDTEKVHSFKNVHSECDHKKLRSDEVEQEDYQERIVLQLAEQEEEDLNRIKEESRRRRLAILEKYKAQQLEQLHEPHLDTGKENMELPSQPVEAANVVSETLLGQSEGADVYLADTSFSVGRSPPQNVISLLQNGISASDKNSGARGLGEGTPKSERSDDMFYDDIFGESPAGVRELGREDGVAIETCGLHDNWDDADGYYSYRFGEILDGRYEIIAAHGKGVFSTVVRVKDHKAGSGEPDEVAIKIIRSNDTMYKAGLEELVILKKLVGADPEHKRHCVLFLSSFKYRNHLCLVFESLHMNLREVLKKFGRNIGLKLTAVRAYAKQLFIALKHLRNCGVLHCDIKPDNMLVNGAKNVLKLCDFGSAMFAGKNEITPYLVSRFYRAPEIILGLHYDHPIDIWSVGCCLFELYTGKVLFPGPTNSDMLRLHMELKGPFPRKMLRKGAFTDQHFDPDLNFLATEEDPVTKQTIKKLILNIKPKDIGTIVSSSPGEDPKMLINFKDLLQKIFMLDPNKRITVSQALSHPFITGK